MLGPGQEVQGSGRGGAEGSSETQRKSLDSVPQAAGSPGDLSRSHPGEVDSRKINLASTWDGAVVKETSVCGTDCQRNPPPHRG